MLPALPTSGPSRIRSATGPKKRFWASFFVGRDTISVDDGLSLGVYSAR